MTEEKTAHALHQHPLGSVHGAEEHPASAQVGDEGGIGIGRMP